MHRECGIHGWYKSIQLTMALGELWNVTFAHGKGEEGERERTSEQEVERNENVANETNTHTHIEREFLDGNEVRSTCIDMQKNLSANYIQQLSYWSF